MLKYNANQRYTTTAITAAIVREVAKGGMPGEEDVPLQVTRCGRFYFDVVHNCF